MNNIGSERNILSMSRTAWLVWQLTALCCSTWSSSSKMVSFSSFTWFSAWIPASSTEDTRLLSSCSLISARSCSWWHLVSTCACVFVRGSWVQEQKWRKRKRGNVSRESHGRPSLDGSVKVTFDSIKCHFMTFPTSLWCRDHIPFGVFLHSCLSNH